MINIAKYSARTWAVKLDGELLAVTVYKKGALAVAKLIAELTGKPITLS
jgi:hypothetical protein